MRNKSWDNQWLLIYFTTAEFRERGSQPVREKGRGRLSKMCLNAILTLYVIDVINGVMNHTLRFIIIIVYNNG